MFGEYANTRRGGFKLYNFLYIPQELNNLLRLSRLIRKLSWQPQNKDVNHKK